MVDVLNPKEKFTTTTVNKSPAHVWDAAWKSGVIEIDRREQRFVLIRMDVLAKTIDDARNNRPQSIDDMLSGYDRAAAKEKTEWFLNDAPEGRELL
jgi:hypothetical protein